MNGWTVEEVSPGTFDVFKDGYPVVYDLPEGGVEDDLRGSGVHQWMHTDYDGYVHERVI